MKTVLWLFSALSAPSAVKLLAFCITTAPAFGQPADGALVRGESAQTRKRLAEAERKLAQNPAEATAELLAILTEAGDDLVTTDGRAFQPARRSVHAALARLPADALRAYRDRADAPARDLLARGTAARDPRPLRELLDRYFASRPAEDALRLLGELAFERGEFRAAEAYWRALLPDSGEALRFPDPAGDVPATRARVTLALLFAGELDRARTELTAIQKLHPTAGGRLAGRDGPFAATLEALLAAPPPVLPSPSPDGEWPTFAASPSRVGDAGGRLPSYWPTRPTWATPIPPAAGPPPNRTRPFAATGRECAFHPVVLGGKAYLADAVRVLGFDLRTGAGTVAFDFRTTPIGERFGAALDLALPPPPNSDFTLTAAEGRLVARVGPSAVAAPSGDAARGPTSYLVGLIPSGDALRADWTLTPPGDPGGSPTAWEGAPVADGGRLFAAFARFEGNRVVHAVAAFDDPPSRPVWVAEVAETTASADPRPRPELLTLAGPNLVFCSQTGVVAAVDAATGKPAWAFRYPRKPPSSGTPSPRDLGPAVAGAGRVFVAPADAEAVFALDAFTGALLWEAGPVQVEQLLGVTRGRLVVTTAEPARGIRGLSVANGSHREPDGWATHDDPHLRSFGRGLVSPDLVLWPTNAAEGTFLLRPADGTRATGLSLPGARGNLAFADGVLLAATPTELWGYVPEPADGSGDRQGERLTNRAERAAAAGDSALAARLFRECLAAPGVTDPFRVRAVARLAELERGAGEQFLARLAVPAGLRSHWVYGPHGRPVRLREFVENPTAAAAVPADGTFPRRRPPDPRDPLPRPSLGPSAAVTTEVMFPSAAAYPLRPFPADADPPGLTHDQLDDARRLLVADGGRLVAYRPHDHQPAWAANLPAGFRPTHGTVVGDRLVLAGPNGIAVLRFSDGTVLADVRVPEADPSPPPGVSGEPIPRSAGMPPPTPGLSGFALAGSRVVAKLGDHHLAAIDASAGRFAWVLDAAGRSRFTPAPFPGGPRFSPPFAADPGHVVAHLSDGRRWVVAVDTGRVIVESPSSLLPWPGMPAPAGPGAVAVPDGPGRVTAFDPTAGRLRWKFDAGGDGSLAGRPPRVRDLDGGVVVAVARNHGTEIDRLREIDGSRVWRAAAFLAADDIELSHAAADEARLYLPAGGRLTAVGWGDGRTAWVADLAAEVGVEVGWVVRVGRRGLVAVPTTAVPADPPADALARGLRRFAADPHPWRLPGLSVAAYDAWAARSVPVLVLDPATGAVRHRLDLPATGPAVVAGFAPGAAVVATVGKAYWLR